MIQVTTSLDNPEVKKREIEGLIEAMLAYGLHAGMILTENESQTMEVEGMKISVLPIWKWLLGKA